jgi:site-specific recombinase XerD
MKNNQSSLTSLVHNMLFAMQTSGRSARTFQYYQRLLAPFLEFARDQHWPANPDLITANHIRHFLAWTGSRTGTYLAGHGVSRCYQPRPTKAWPYFKAIRRLYNWGIDEKLVTSNPAAAIRYKAPPTPPVMPYSPDELHALIAVCDQDISRGGRFCGTRNKACLLLFLDGGLRLKEMANLAIDDLDLKEQYVRVLGKGNRSDYCPFSTQTKAVLEAYLTQRKTRTKTDRLWIKENGRPLNQAGMVSWFRILKRRAENRSPGAIHRLRHSSAMLYLRGAKDSFLLQLFLRHADLAMTRRYTQGLKKEEAMLAHRNGASPVERLGIGTAPNKTEG